MARKRAFSLLEMLVVIVILAALATFGHAMYVAYVTRSKINEALNVLEEYQAQALALRARSGTIDPYYVLFPDGDETGLISGTPGSSSAKTVGLKYVTEVTADTGTSGSNTYILLGAKLANDNVITTGADFVYVVGTQTPTGTLSWQCGISTSKGNTLDPAYLPSTCQNVLP